MLDWPKIAAAGVAGALLASGPVFLYGKSIGRAGVELQAAKSALERIEQLEKNNANFKRLPGRDRCVIFMRDSGLPIEQCD